MQPLAGQGIAQDPGDLRLGLAARARLNHPECAAEAHRREEQVARLPAELAVEVEAERGRALSHRPRLLARRDRGRRAPSGSLGRRRSGFGRGRLRRRLHAGGEKDKQGGKETLHRPIRPERRCPSAEPDSRSPSRFGYSAVVGSIVARTRAMLLAGKPAVSA
jgi:hypothetical protein